MVDSKRSEKSCKYVIRSCCKKVDKIFDKLHAHVFSLIKLITTVNLRLSINIYVRVEKRL